MGGFLSSVNDNASSTLEKVLSGGEVNVINLRSPVVVESEQGQETRNSGSILSSTTKSLCD